jgi:hypothetical protein
MKQTNLTPEEILELFFARLQGARNLVPAGSSDREKARYLRKALAVSGITKIVARDVLDVPPDWWSCEELSVWLPPLERLPPLEGVLAAP